MEHINGNGESMSFFFGSSLSKSTVMAILLVITSYNPIYRMYNPIRNNQL